MVYAMIFGAHLLPYGWTYESKAYYTFAVLITIVVLLVGISFSAKIVAAVMFFMEIALSLCLALEVKKLDYVV